MSQASEEPIPIINVETERKNLSARTTKDRRLLGEIEVRSKEQPHMSLGNYTSAKPPKGFAIHIIPDPEPDAIVAQIVRTGSNKEYELVLHIANYGNETISAEVWQLE